jgi:Flp pilus assembly protein TadD
MRTSSNLTKTLTLTTALVTLAAGFAACERPDDSARRRAAAKNEAPKPQTSGVAPVPVPVPAPPAPAPSDEKDVLAKRTAAPVLDATDEGDVDADIDDGDLPTDALSLARKALDEGDYEKAMKLSKKAVDKTPGRWIGWNTLGRAQLQLGKRKAAITSFEKAVELNPDSSYAHNNLGLTLIYEKRYGEAVEVLEEAIELGPVTGFMWNNLGMALEQMDRLQEARDAYAKAVELDSDKARESLARLEGVKSVFRTAQAETPPADGSEGTVTRQ